MVLEGRVSLACDKEPYEVHSLLGCAQDIMVTIFVVGYCILGFLNALQSALLCKLDTSVIVEVACL